MASPYYFHNILGDDVTFVFSLMNNCKGVLPVQELEQEPSTYDTNMDVKRPWVNVTMVDYQQSFHMTGVQLFCRYH